MIIQNLNFSNNNIYNKKQNISNLSFNGKINKLPTEFQLNPNELKQVSFISELYEKVLTLISYFNGIDQTKLKTLYPNLVAGEKMKGLVFKSLAGFNDKRLQIVRFNTNKSSDELLTFGVLDKENKNIIRFRIDKDGNVLTFGEDEKINTLKQNPFEEVKKSKNKFINLFINEMEKLKFFGDNFQQIKKSTKNQTNENKIFNAMSKLKALEKSVGFKSEIEDLNFNYFEVSDLLNLTKGKDSPELKKAYFGEDYNIKTKGLTFKNLTKDNPIVNFCPLKSKDDDRVFKIVIFDENEKPQNAFVFFKDGKVATQKVLNIDTNGFRPNNLEFISDDEVQNMNFKEIFENLNVKFSDFKEFVTEQRNAKKIAKIERKENKLAEINDKKLKKEENKANKLKEMQLKKEQAKAEREKELQLKKEEKKAQQQLEKERIKKEKEEQRQLKQAKKDEEKRIKLELAKQKKEELERIALIKSKEKFKKEEIKRLNKEKAEQLRLEKQQKAEADKLRKEQIKKMKEELKLIKKTQAVENKKLEIDNSIPASTTIPKSHIIEIAPNYSKIVLHDIVEGLNKIFDTPIEERSHHLIHEKLPNGNIFNGRFSLKTENGANITVTRIKSPKYVEFTYYSIKINKNGESLTFNIDPQSNKIIQSQNGKPIIKDGIYVQYISKEDYLSKNPMAKDLPIYLNNIFEYNTTDTKKVIQLKNSKTSVQKNLLKEKESEILKSLQQNSDDSILE